MALRQKALEPIDEEARRILRARVDASGLSQAAIAKRTGLSQNRVSIILRGDTPPASVGELAMIADAVGARISPIVSEAEERALKASSVRSPHGMLGLAASRHQIEDEPEAP